jgi:hypothetical protein
MWLVWLGESMLALEQTWRHYLRRFAVDHWNRFVKQRLHWTLPHFGTTELENAGATSCRCSVRSYGWRVR